jgi:putative hydrolase of the HAD superfamily
MNIVFDFGAVLFEWQPTKVLAYYFPDHNHAQLAKDVFSHADWHAFDAGLISPQEVTQRTLARTGLPRVPFEQMVANIPDALKPIESSVALLRELTNQKTPYGIRSLTFLSNMPEPYSRALEQRHAFLQCFDSGVFSGDVKLAKPDAAIYELVEQRLHAIGKDILFIDDHAANIAAAQRRGWQTIHLTQPEDLPGLLDQILAKR